MTLDGLRVAVEYPFALNNDRQHNINSMSTRRSSQRSPSPRNTFTSALYTVKDTSKGSKRRSTKRSISNGDASSSDSHTTNGGPGADDGKDPPTKKIDWEIPRKTFHSSIGFIVLPLYMTQASTRHIVLYLTIALAIIAPLDVIRLRYPAFERLYEKVVGFLMRESEKRKSNGVIWYLLGVIFVLAIYPREVGVVSILILSWCDTLASVTGRLYGPRTFPLPQSLLIPFTPYRIPIPFAQRKSLAGFIGASVTGCLIAATFWGYIVPLSYPNESCDVSGYDYTICVKSKFNLSVVSAVVGLIAGVCEALDIGSLDDNLTLPIFSGSAIWGFLKCYEWLMQ